ncbi:hypothetical protein [Faecalispora anaeroviscerum]|uniref:hypothetical protein n=1 Tax=Faecalispora anaeroviscerum TaxID=2991836 RepID=UPI0024B8A4A0|nr:hypothetical protein [Faecalispora anaeroviscerum]
MMISKILKALGIIVVAAAAYFGAEYGSSSVIPSNFSFNLAVCIWGAGAISGAVLYGIGEIIDQLGYTNYMLSHSLTPLQISENQTKEQK